MVARWDAAPARSPDSWRLDFAGEAPSSLNDERSSHWSARAETTKRWRAAFCALARAQGIPPLGAITVEALPCGVRHDCGNDLPSIKAAVDGLVDAAVIVDDGPDFVVSILMHAPAQDEPPGLRLLIRRAV